MTFSILELCGILAAIATVAGVCTKLFLSKLGDVREIVEREIASIAHKVANNHMRIDALEKKDDDKEVRLIRVEIAIDNMEKGLQRVEAEVKDSRLHIEQKLDKKFDTLSKLISGK